MREPPLLVNLVSGQYPGSTNFTRTPKYSSSNASDPVNPSMAVLLAVYAAARGIRASVTLEVTLIKTPERLARNCGITAWDIAMTPNVFVSKTSRIVDMGVASNAPTTPIPALLTNTSMGPLASNAANDGAIGLVGTGCFVASAPRPAIAACRPYRKGSLRSHGCGDGFPPSSVERERRSTLPYRRGITAYTAHRTRDRYEYRRVDMRECSLATTHTLRGSRSRAMAGTSLGRTQYPMLKRDSGNHSLCRPRMRPRPGRNYRRRLTRAHRIAPRGDANARATQVVRGKCQHLATSRLCCAALAAGTIWGWTGANRGASVAASAVGAWHSVAP